MGHKQETYAQDWMDEIQGGGSRLAPEERSLANQLSILGGRDYPDASFVTQTTSELADLAAGIRDSGKKGVHNYQSLRSRIQRAWQWGTALIGIALLLVVLIFSISLLPHNTGAPGAAQPSPTSTALTTQPASPTATRSPSPTPQTYLVKEGDTCTGIALFFGVSVQSITTLNNLPVECNTLLVNQTLLIPQPTPTITALHSPTPGSTQQTENACQQVEYTVQEGDTLAGIAATYNVPVESIQAFNALGGGMILLGQTLHIPLCMQFATSEPASSTNGLLLPSPDGQWTAILDREAGSLVVEDLQGMKQSPFPANGAASEVKWAPDSRRLAVVLNNPPTNQGEQRDNPPEIRILVWNSGLFQDIGTPYRPDGSADSPPMPEQIVLGGWSPDSRQISFWSGSQSSSIQADGLPLWVLDIESMQAVRLSEATLVNPTYQSWSPDSRGLVFTDGGYRSAQVNKWLSLYEVATGQITTLISQHELVPGKVSWSPSGGTIALAAVEASQTGDEWAAQMDWNNQAILARRIYLLELQNGEYRRLNSIEAYQDAPRWSADGKTLDYVQLVGNLANIITADPVTGEAVPIPDCQMPAPSVAGYYGQVDWNELYLNCLEK